MCKVIVTFLLCLTCVSNAQGQISISIQGISVQPGDVARIPVMISGGEGLDITSVQISLAYAGDVLDITSIDTGGTLFDTLPLSTNLDNPGRIKLAGAWTNSLEGSGVLFYLVGHFKGDDVLGERIFTPQFEELLFFNSNSEPLPIQTELSPFSVKGSVVVLGELNTDENNSFNIPIQLRNLGSIPAASYQLDILFDPEVIDIQDVTNGNSLSNDGIFTVNDGVSGRLKIAYASSFHLSGDGNLFFLSGERLIEGDPLFQLQGVRFFDRQGNPVPVAPVQFDASLPEETDREGNQLTYTVPAGNINGVGLVGYQFSLAYNPTIISIDDIELSGSLSSGRNVVVQKEEGLINVAWAGAEPLAGNGPLIKFLATEKQTDDPRFQYQDFKLVGSNRISEVGIPDLILENLSVTPNPATAGEELEINFVLKNVGDGDAGAFQTNVRMSTSSTEVTDDDELLYFCELDGLAAGAGTTDCSSSISLSNDLVGTFYIWVITDVDGEAGQINEENDKSKIVLNIVSRINTAGFLTLPFSTQNKVKITSGWYYDSCVLHAPSGAIDYDATITNTDEGFPVLAAAGGVVFYNRNHPSRPDLINNYGNLFILKHSLDNGDVYFSMYAHLKELPAFEVGDILNRGDFIGEAGKTGGPNYDVHLHFELRKENADFPETENTLPRSSISIDPYDLYRSRDGSGCLENENDLNAYPDPIDGPADRMGVSHLWSTDPPSYSNFPTLSEVHNSPLPEDVFPIINYPNPFSNTTNISFITSETGKVIIRVYDILGREVATLQNATIGAGEYNIIFRGVNIPSGIYVVEMLAKGKRSHILMTKVD